MSDRSERLLNFLAWFGAAIGGFVALTAFAFTNFETVKHAEEVSQGFEKRLDRIEDKIDQVLTIQRRGK